MRVGSWQFTPRPLMVLLYLLIGGAMLSLGFWQLDRAEQKIQLQAQASAANNAKPATLSAVDLAEPDFVYQRVSVSGRFEAARQLLWDNRVTNGVAGYEVITPFRLVTGELILVNRGWLPAGLDRSVLPDIGFELQESDESTIIGMLTRPSIGFSSGPAVESAAGWPRRVQHFAFDEIAAVFDGKLLPGLLQDVTTEAVPMYNNVWMPAASGPQRHYGYAFQWFAMFAALTGLFLFLNSHRDVAPGP